nr:neurogenic locus notch homolog protein 3-like [Danaus plexippus plexippus]
MRYRRDIQWGSCTGSCAHGGRCVSGVAGGACACAGAWGGSRCRHYVGHDNACVARACAPPAVCVWKASDNPSEPGTPYCACSEGVQCSDTGVGAEGAGWGTAGGAALLALAAVLAVLLAALYVAHRRRQ